MQKKPVLWDSLKISLDKQLADYDRIFLHVFAPTIVSYVEWAIEQAVSSGKKRLYFLARDGWLMHFIAEQIVRSRKIDMELRYLKVSRYSLRMAEYSILGRECLDTICVGGIDISFRKMMMRGAFTEEEIQAVAKETGYEDKLDQPLNYRQIQEVKKKLEQIGLFFQYIDYHSKECYESTAGYLRQEGLMDEVPYSIVDSGWIGTTQRSIERILTKESGSAIKIDGYYFGVYEVPKGSDRDCYHGYYIRPGQDIGRKIKFSVCLFETIFSSPEGMTWGYRKADRPDEIEVAQTKDIQSVAARNIYVPVESGQENPNKEIMLRNKNLIDCYLRGYLKCLNHGGNKDEDQIKIIEKLLSLCMGNPTTIEAKILGGLQFCDDVLELQMQNVAAEWDKNELKKQRFLNRILIKLDIREGELHESGWPEGSIVNLGQRSGIRQEHLYKYFMYLRKAIVS